MIEIHILDHSNIILEILDARVFNKVRKLCYFGLVRLWGEASPELELKISDTVLWGQESLF